MVSQFTFKMLSIILFNKANSVFLLLTCIVWLEIFSNAVFIFAFSSSMCEIFDLLLEKLIFSKPRDNKFTWCNGWRPWRPPLRPIYRNGKVSSGDFLTTKLHCEGSQSLNTVVENQSKSSLCSYHRLHHNKLLFRLYLSDVTVRLVWLYFEKSSVLTSMNSWLLRTPWKYQL